MNLRQLLIPLAGLLLPLTAAAGQIHTETVEYEHDGEVLEGYLAHPEGARNGPAVLIVHEWWGINDYVRGRAEQLAQLGYTAFAMDMYGKGVRAETADEAGELARKYRGGDRQNMRDRTRRSLDLLRDHPAADPRRTVAIGYCFGGTAVLELARDGADIAGFVSFHGNLNTPRPAGEGDINGPVLVLHGAADPLVPPEEVAGFREEMANADADWQLIEYGGAVHAFTNPDAGDDPTQPLAYDRKADRRSLRHMLLFFDEGLGAI